MKFVSRMVRSLLAIGLTTAAGGASCASSPVQWPHVEIMRGEARLGVLIPSMHDLDPQLELRFAPLIERLLDTRPVWIELGSDDRDPPTVVAKRLVARGQGLRLSALPAATRERIEQRLQWLGTAIRSDELTAGDARFMLDICPLPADFGRPPPTVAARRPGIEDRIAERRRRAGKGTQDIEEAGRPAIIVSRLTVEQWTREFDSVLARPALSCEATQEQIARRDADVLCGRFDIPSLGVPDAELRGGGYPATEALLFGERERRHADVLLRELERGTQPIFVIGAVHAGPNSEVTRRLLASGYRLKLVRDEAYCGSRKH